MIGPVKIDLTAHVVKLLDAAMQRELARLHQPSHMAEVIRCHALSFTKDESPTEITLSDQGHASSLLFLQLLKRYDIPFTFYPPAPWEEALAAAENNAAKLSVCLDGGARIDLAPEKSADLAEKLKPLYIEQVQDRLADIESWLRGTAPDTYMPRSRLNECYEKISDPDISQELLLWLASIAGETADLAETLGLSHIAKELQPLPGGEATQSTPRSVSELTRLMREGRQNAERLIDDNNYATNWFGSVRVNLLQAVAGLNLGHGSSALRRA